MGSGYVAGDENEGYDGLHGVFVVFCLEISRSCVKGLGKSCSIFDLVPDTESASTSCIYNYLACSSTTVLMTLKVRNGLSVTQLD